VTPPRVAASLPSSSAGAAAAAAAAAGDYPSAAVPGPRSPGPQYQPLNLCLPPGVAVNSGNNSSSSSSSGGGPGVPVSGGGGRREWSMVPLGPSCIDQSAARNREAEVVASMGFLSPQEPQDRSYPLAYATGRGSNSLERDSRESSLSSDSRSGSSGSSYSRSYSRSHSRGRNVGQPSGLWGSRVMARATTKPHAEHGSPFSTCDSEERDPTPPSA